MTLSEKTKAAIDALGDLIGSYPEGSDKAKALKHARGIVVDVMMDEPLTDLSTQVYALAGENARMNLRQALKDNQQYSKLARLVQNSALVDELAKG